MTMGVCTIVLLSLLETGTMKMQTMHSDYGASESLCIYKGRLVKRLLRMTGSRAVVMHFYGTKALPFDSKQTDKLGM